MIRFLFAPLFRVLFFAVCIFLGLCCTPTGIWAASSSVKPLIVSIYRAYSPFTIISPTGEPAGLFVDMWRLWSKQTGVPVEFLVEDWPGSIQALRDGRADVHSGLFVNEQRAQWMAFSQPIHEIKTSLFFRTNEETRLTIEEMAGKKVGALEGTYQLQYLLDFHKKIQAASYPDGRTLLLALLKGDFVLGAKENCPKTCTNCCQDTIGKFLLSNGKSKSCEWAGAEDTEARCNKSPTRIKCAVTCGAYGCSGSN